MPCAVCKRPVSDDERFCKHCRTEATKGRLTAPLVLVVGLGLVGIKSIFEAPSPVDPQQAAVVQPQEPRAPKAEDESPKPVASPHAPPHPKTTVNADVIREESTPTESEPNDVTTLRNRATAIFASYENSTTRTPVELLRDFDAQTSKLRGNPNDVDAYILRASVRSEMKEYVAAKADYSTAIRLMPQHVDAYLLRAYAEVELKDFDAAIADCSYVIRTNDQYAYAYEVRGEVLSGKGDYEGAVADYSQAIRLEPFDYDLYHMRGEARAALKDYGAAIADYTESIRLGSGGESYRKRADARAALKDYEGAKADYKEAITRGPNRGVFR